MDNLTGQDIDRNLLLEQSIITPACGTGSRSREEAHAILDLLGQTGRSLQA